MKSILQINASLYSADGESSRLAGEFAAKLREQEPSAQVRLRDLARDAVPHLDAQRFAAFTTRKEDRSAAQQSVVEYSDALIDELKGADAIVLGLPTYNFGVPSTLKAWIDHVARAGVTFRYTENGPVGLLTGKKAYVIATRGGRYAGTPGDNVTPYIRQLLGFLGITDVEFVYAEGLATGETARSQALGQARAAIRRVTDEALAAA